MITIKVTPRELATIMAAVNHWQHIEKHTPMRKFKKSEDRKGTYFEKHLPLTIKQMDKVMVTLAKAERGAS